jgi:hypothetical protein
MLGVVGGCLTQFICLCNNGFPSFCQQYIIRRSIGHITVLDHTHCEASSFMMAKILEELRVPQSYRLFSIYISHENVAKMGIFNGGVFEGNQISTEISWSLYFL